MARCAFILRTLRFALVFWALFACGVAETSHRYRIPKSFAHLTREGQPPVRLTAADFAKLTRQQ